MSILNNAVIAVRKTNLSQIAEYTPSEKIQALQKQVSARFPMLLKALRFIDANINGKKNCKGYYLVRRSNKTQGFSYYVRYIHKGRTLPSMWNTRANIRELAELFARDNRERIVEEYLAKTDKRLFTIFENYYEKDSKYFIEDQNINGKLCENLRRIYLNFIIKRFTPFLRAQKVYTFAGISAAVIARLQNALLNEGVKPQSINGYMASVKRIFRILIRSGEIKENIFNNVSSLTVFEDDVNIRGCHDIERLNGVFNDEWTEDKHSYLLCLTIYSTGLRNGEIENLKVSDIIKMDDCCFLNIRKSKTKNGVRIIPLHDFLYKKLIKHIEDRELDGDDFILRRKGEKRIYFYIYRKANLLLAKKLGLDEAYLDKNHISFYSGRHF
jgi:integrase